MISFFWLRASTAANGVTEGWQYRWTGVLLVIEVLLITLITLLVTLSAAWFAIQQGPKTIEIYRQMQQATLKHASAHDIEDVKAQPTLRSAEPFAGPMGELGDGRLG